MAWEEFTIVPRRLAGDVSSALRRISDWAATHCVSLECLQDQPFGQKHIVARYSSLPAAPEMPFDVEVSSALYSRLGNNLIQFLNAIVIGSMLGCERVSLPDPRGLSLTGSARLGNCLVEARGERPAAELGARHVLSGQFYAARGFEACFSNASDALLVNAARTLSALTPWPAFPPGFDPLRTIVMHIRGGDVFGDNRIHPWYAQPPAGFYLASALDARRFGVDRVLIVAEDSSNPVLECLMRSLPELGFETDVQSDTLLSDFAALRRARYLVQSFGTFAESAAFISDQLAHLWSFRQISSQWGQGDFGGSVVSVLPRLFRAKGVACLVGHDLSGEAIVPGAWKADARQRELLVTIPPEAIALQPVFVTSV